MSRLAFRCFLISSAILSSVSCTDDRIHFVDEENRYNAPQPAELGNNQGEIEPRFLPFSTSFSVGLGPDRGHSFGISSNKDGISVSRSTSLGGSGPLAGSRSNSFSAGLSGVAASDSNAYNFFGKSKANTNAFSLGDAKASSQADVKDGKVSSGAQSSVGNDYNRASSGASSHAGNGEAGGNADASATQNNQYPNQPYYGQRNDNRQHGLHIFRPHYRESGLGINIRKHYPRQPDEWENRKPDIHVTNWRPRHEGPWRRSTNCGTFPNWNPDCNSRMNLASENINSWPQPYPIDANQNQYYPQSGLTGTQVSGDRRPENTRVSAASASSSASSSGNGFAFSHSSSQSNVGPNGPSSQTKNQLFTSGDANSQAQGVAAGIQQNANGQTHGSFSSGNIAGSSKGEGQSSSIALSGNQGEESHGEVNSSAKGPGSADGNADAASVTFDNLPKNEPVQQDDVIPAEFVRSGLDIEDNIRRDEPVEYEADRNKPEVRGRVRKILSGINNAVTGIFRH